MDVFNNGKSRPISWPLHDGEIELCSQGTFDFFGVPHFSDKQIWNCKHLHDVLSICLSFSIFLGACAHPNELLSAQPWR